MMIIPTGGTYIIAPKKNRKTYLWGAGEGAALQRLLAHYANW